MQLIITDTLILLLEAAKAVSNIETTLVTTLSQMTELAKSLPEFSTVRSMPALEMFLHHALLLNLDMREDFTVRLH